MIRMKIPGVKTYASKGRIFRYHRATGVRLKELPGTPAFLAEYAAAEAKRLDRVHGMSGDLHRNMQLAHDAAKAIG